MKRRREREVCCARLAALITFAVCAKDIGIDEREEDGEEWGGSVPHVAEQSTYFFGRLKISMRAHKK